MSDRLELERNVSLHKREWKVQHVGWLLGAAVIAIALAGLLGAGPLSNTEASSEAGAVRVLYNRFVHYNNEIVLRVQLASLGNTAESIELKLPHSYLQRARIRRIHPEPVRSHLAADGTAFEFARATGASEAAVDFHLEFCQYGRATGSVELVGGEAVKFSQFVYP